MTPAEYAVAQRRLAEAARAADRRKSGAVRNRFDSLRARLQKQLPPRTEFVRVRRPANPIGTTYQRYERPEDIPEWEKYSPEAKAAVYRLWDKLDRLSEGRVQQEPEELRQSREEAVQQKREEVRRLRQKREVLQQRDREYARVPEPSREADVEEEPAGKFTGWQTALEAAVAQAEQAASEAEQIAAGNERWEFRSSRCGSVSQRAMIASHRWFQDYARFIPTRDRDTTTYRQLRARLRAAVDRSIDACGTIRRG